MRAPRKQITKIPNSMKLISIYIISTFIISCSGRHQEDIFNQELEKNLTNYFEADSVSLMSENNLYFVKIYDCKVENTYLLEEFSKIAALNFYRTVIKPKPEIEFSTKVIIEIKGKFFKKYIFEISFLADIDNGFYMSEDVIFSLKTNIVPLEFFLLEQECNNTPILGDGINWNNTNSIDLISFEESQFNLCEENIPTILYRINLSPENEIIWIYYSIESKKIVAIIPNQD